MRASIVVIALFVIALAYVDTVYAKCKTCSDDYTPVCGMVGGTRDKPKVTRFGNKCVLENYRCESGKDVPELPASSCGPNAPERLQ